MVEVIGTKRGLDSSFEFISLGAQVIEYHPRLCVLECYSA